MFQNLESSLVCPSCKSKLWNDARQYVCSNFSCQGTYPIQGHIPVLVDERVSTFSVAPGRNGTDRANWTAFRKWVKSFTPRLTANFAVKKTIPKLRQLLLANTSNPKVLILGGAEIGEGLKSLLKDQRIQFLETDIAIGSRTELVCDASFLPFEDESADGVIIQAVLEYVLEPKLCVQEIHRVLRPGGLVYSEMPFLQDVHGGRYDFTRLTHLGHRRLYREFSEIASGACAGPATALAWSMQHFFLSFVQSLRMRDAVKLASSLALFWVKYFDHVLAQTPAGLDGATGTYLLARKNNFALSDKDLVASYRGAVPQEQSI